VRRQYDQRRHFRTYAVPGYAGRFEAGTGKYRRRSRPGRRIDYVTKLGMDLIDQYDIIYWSTPQNY